MHQIVDAYYKDNNNSRKALNNLLKDGKMLEVLTLTDRKTRVVAYARPRDGSNVLDFEDKNGRVEARVSLLGLETFKVLEEPLKLVCSSPRITDHGGRMEILISLGPTST